MHSIRLNSTKLSEKALVQFLSYVSNLNFKIHCLHFFCVLSRKKTLKYCICRAKSLSWAALLDYCIKNHFLNKIFVFINGDHRSGGFSSAEHEFSKLELGNQIVMLKAITILPPYNKSRSHVAVSNKKMQLFTMSIFAFRHRNE